MINIVRSPKWIGGSGAENTWIAEEVETKRRGTSLCGAIFAARQCALNYFFGGSTNAFVRGRKDRVTVKKQGARFVAVYANEAA